MILIDDVIISSDVVSKQFVCDLNACKGVCCIEGEGGAPLEENEVKIIEEIFSEVKPYLRKEGLEEIEKQGLYTTSKDSKKATPLIDGGACVYVIFDEAGVTKCGIEKAWEDGKINFQKPVSCHLYPVRTKNMEEMTAVNYEKWEICSAACALGEQLQVPVYKFVKDALIRKFGSLFYQRLDESAKIHNSA